VAGDRSLIGHHPHGVLEHVVVRQDRGEAFLGERNRALLSDRHEERLVDQGSHDGGEPFVVELPFGLQGGERCARGGSRRERHQHRQGIEIHVLGRARDRAGGGEPAGAQDLEGQGTGYHVRNVPLHRATSSGGGV